MSSLNSVCQLISDAIWDEVDVSKDNKKAAISNLFAQCISLEAAREFIDENRLAVVIPEDLANAIKAEANLSVDDPRAGLAPGAEGVHWSEFTPEPTDNRYPFESRYPLDGDLNSKAIENLCVDDHRASLALEAEGVTWSDFTPEPTDSKNRNYSEDRTELGDELNSQLVERLYKDAIESHDQQVRAGGVLANATSADVELPLKVIKLGPLFAAEGLQMSRAVQPCFLSPELLCASVPAAPNISYQRSLPTIDGVKCVLTGAGPYAIARMCVNIISLQHIAPCRQRFQCDASCRYRPIVVRRLIDAPRRLPSMSTPRKDFYSRSPDSEDGDN